MSRLVLRAAPALVALAALATAVPAATATRPEPSVVVLVDTPDCAATTQAVTAAHDIRVTDTYTAAFCGFSARLTADEVAALLADPAVESVSADGTGTGV